MMTYLQDSIIEKTLIELSSLISMVDFVLRNWQSRRKIKNINVFHELFFILNLAFLYALLFDFLIE